MDEIEVWRNIPGYRGYQASSLGQVRSVDRTLANGRRTGGQLLTQSPDKDGYLRVKIAGKPVAVHLLVLLAHHGKPEGRHLDGNRTDNRSSKLAWGSHLDNERDKLRHRAERASGPLAG